MTIQWQPIPRKIQGQYNVSKKTFYTQVEHVRLAGDDTDFPVTADVMATPSELVIGFYRYSDNLMDDFQLTFSKPVSGIAEGQTLAEEVLEDGRFVTLRYLNANGFQVW